MHNIGLCRWFLFLLLILFKHWVIPGTTTESIREIFFFLKLCQSRALTCHVTISDHLGMGLSIYLIYLLRSDLTEQNQVFIQMSGVLFIIWYGSMFILYVYEFKMTHLNLFAFPLLVASLSFVCVTWLWGEVEEQEQFGSQRGVKLFIEELLYFSVSEWVTVQSNEWRGIESNEHTVLINRGRWRWSWAHRECGLIAIAYSKSAQGNILQERLIQITWISTTRREKTMWQWMRWWEFAGWMLKLNDEAQVSWQEVL